jgi:hypothetical protein
LDGFLFLRGGICSKENKGLKKGTPVPKRARGQKKFSALQFLAF